MVKYSLQEELDKSYYNINFLEGFKLRGKLNISAIVPTYNRCPYALKSGKFRLNPLVISVESLIGQKPGICEIVIVNDYSKDYTDEAVKYLKPKIEKAGIKLIYIKNKRKKGSSKSRNIGVKSASADFVYFTDDDGVSAPYSAFGAMHVFEELCKEGIRVGVIHLPFCTRATRPIKTISRRKMGQLNLMKGGYSSHFTEFPREFLTDKDKFIDKEFKILKPIQIHNLNGLFLCSKKVYENMGGFPEYFNWKNSAFEETEFACKLIENGYVLFFLPDPKFRIIHGQFGMKRRVELSKYDKRNINQKINSVSLKEFIDECNIPRLNTGNRVSTEEWCYSKIIAFFVVLYRRNREGAFRWAEKCYEDFVNSNKKSFIGPIGGDVIVDREEREKIWYKAIIDGLELISKVNKMSTWDFLRSIDSIRKESTIDKLRILGERFK